MKKLMLFTMIGLFQFTHAQLKISGHVYEDSTLTTKLHKVKIYAISNYGEKECFRTNKEGKYEIIIDKPKKEYSLLFKKKNYTSLELSSYTVDKGKPTRYEVDVILTRTSYVHDKVDNGLPKVVSSKKINIDN